MRIAETSTMKQKHGAVIVKSGSVVSLGVNSFRNDPRYVFQYDRCSEHAEVCAIRLALARRPKVDLRGAEIYVARVNNAGQERYSRPCTSCHKFIVKHGISKIIYSID